MQWGGGRTAIVDTAEDLDQVLADIEHQRGAGGAPFQVSIAAADPDADPFDQETLQVGIGHPTHAFAFWSGEGDGGYAREPGFQPLPDSIAFDLGGQWTEYHPDETQVSAGLAKTAAREFVRTGARPRCVEWLS